MEVLNRILRSSPKIINTTCYSVARGSSTGCYDKTCINGDCAQISRFQGKCICDPGWIGRTCEKCCDLSCQNDGVCDVDFTTGLQFCSCHVNRTFTGTFCEEPRNFTEPVIVKVDRSVYNTIIEWEIPVIVSLVLFAILATSLFSTLYWLYRTRHPLLIRYIVRYHDKFVNDSSRKFDVFISYVSNHPEDRTFAVSTLLTYLENMGYSVCLTDRNFCIGASQFDSIVEAIESSKRTILVISPDFIEEEWREFEIQQAIIESLKKHHRIIPIIFRPIDEERQKISHTLKHILDAITFLVWPHDSNEKKKIKFWKRLKAVLPTQPDKQTSESEQDISKSSTLLRLQSQTYENSLLHPSSGETGKKGNLLNNITFRQMFVLKRKPRKSSSNDDTCDSDEDAPTGMELGMPDVPNSPVQDSHSNHSVSTRDDNCTEYTLSYEHLDHKKKVRFQSDDVQRSEFTRDMKMESPNYTGMCYCDSQNTTQGHNITKGDNISKETYSNVADENITLEESTYSSYPSSSYTECSSSYFTSQSSKSTIDVLCSSSTEERSEVISDDGSSILFTNNTAYSSSRSPDSVTLELETRNVSNESSIVFKDNSGFEDSSKNDSSDSVSLELPSELEEVVATETSAYTSHDMDTTVRKPLFIIEDFDSRVEGLKAPTASIKVSEYGQVDCNEDDEYYSDETIETIEWQRNNNKPCDNIILADELITNTEDAKLHDLPRLEFEPVPKYCKRKTIVKQDYCD